MDLQSAGITVWTRALLFCLLSSTVFAGDAPQTIAFSALTTDTHTLTALASSGLAVSFDSTTPDVCSVDYISVLHGTFPSDQFWAFQLVGLGTCSVTASQAGDSTYAAAESVTQTLSSPAPLPQAIRFPPMADIEFVGSEPGLSASATSGMPVSFASLTPAVCGIGAYVDGSAGIFALYLHMGAPGVCSVAATQTGNAAWLAAPTITQSFTVKAASGTSQTIAFLPLPWNVTFGQTTTVPLNATASSGLPVTFTSNSPGICSVSGANATIVSVGECSITASQSGNASYNAAVPVGQSFEVAPAHATDVNINYLESVTPGVGYSPGSLFSIYGRFMGSGTVNTTAPLPLSSNGTVVTFNGSPCPLLYVSATQITAQIPTEAAPGPATVTVSYSGTSASATISVVAASPGFFTANGMAIAQHGDYSLVTFANPARSGEIVTFYGTGIGPVSPAVASGQPAPDPPNLAVSAATYSATIGGANAPVSFLGLTPGLAGVMQLNLQIPAGTPSGLLSTVLTISGVSSADVTIPVVGQ